MQGEDARTLQRIGALLQRVLIVAGQPASARLLATLLRDIGNCQIWTAAEPQRALELVETTQPLVVFVDQGEGLDGAAFTRQLRRGDLSCRKAPVIVLSVEATAAVILGARDAGVHEFLRKPFTMKDLLRRLEAVATRPRDWVEGIGYVGPDRRRFNSGDYSGPLKRRVDHAVTPDEAKVAQALRILKAALAAIDVDPRPALRAMIAQADEIVPSSTATANLELRAGAVALRRTLAGLSPQTLRREAVEPLVRPLLAFLPADAAASRPAA
ncbi:MAG: response regulator [Caulobacteraceae bacterium]